jgi:hypothetical protein
MKSEKLQPASNAWEKRERGEQLDEDEVEVEVKCSWT